MESEKFKHRIIDIGDKQEKEKALENGAHPKMALESADLGVSKIIRVEGKGEKK